MDIDLYSRLQNPLEAIDRIGEMFAKSGMFGCEKTEQGKVLALICMSERKSPVAITTNYDIVEGKLRKKALAALADFRTTGGKHKWFASGDSTAAKDEDRFAELQLTDRDGNSVTYRYSMADAKAEGLVRDKSRWTKRPGNMLRARCISNGLGMLCPEIFAGEEASLSEPKEAEPLLPAPTEPAPAPKPAPIEVATVVTPQPAPVTTTSDKVAIIQGLEEAIGEANGAKAIEWLTARGWIKTSLADLTNERAQRILAKPEAFLKTIGV